MKARKYAKIIENLHKYSVENSIIGKRKEKQPSKIQLDKILNSKIKVKIAEL